MKILTTKQQNKALYQINTLRKAISSGDEMKILNSIDNLAELTYIIGGMKELKRSVQDF